MPRVMLPPLVARVAARLRLSPAPVSPTGSDLDRVIPPEITGDHFYRAIVEVASTPGVREILEIGSSSGAGSTEAWVSGALQNPERRGSTASRCPRHATPRSSNAGNSTSSFSATTSRACRSSASRRGRSRGVLSRHTLEASSDTTGDRPRLAPPGRRVRDGTGLSQHGIREIRERHGIEFFDAVLIDGSEFTGRAELERGLRRTVPAPRRHPDVQEFRERTPTRGRPAVPARARRPPHRNGFAVFERVG